jgi:hypothetical protein
MMRISDKGLETRKECMSFDELAHIVSDMSLTAWIMAKSYLWRGEEGLPDLQRALHALFPEVKRETSAKGTLRSPSAPKSRSRKSKRRVG